MCFPPVTGSGLLTWLFQVLVTADLGCNTNFHLKLITTGICFYISIKLIIFISHGFILERE